LDSWQINKTIKLFSSVLNYFCKSTEINLIQHLNLVVFTCIDGMKFRISVTSDFFSRPYLNHFGMNWDKSEIYLAQKIYSIAFCSFGLAFITNILLHVQSTCSVLAIFWQLSGLSFAQYKIKETLI